MRISDWSSDVCSSDLGHQLYSGALWAQYRGGGGQRGAAGQPQAWRRGGVAGAGGRSSYFGPARFRAGGKDRKSVVEGKSVSVRVDHGVRRITKKKKIETSK